MDAFLKVFFAKMTIASILKYGMSQGMQLTGSSYSIYILTVGLQVFCQNFGCFANILCIVTVWKNFEVFHTMKENSCTLNVSLENPIKDFFNFTNNENSQWSFKDPFYFISYTWLF